MSKAAFDVAKGRDYVKEERDAIPADVQDELPNKVDQHTVGKRFMYKAYGEESWLMSETHVPEHFPNWGEVELLTAALHHESSEGAVVKWDDKINGRQFDVTVRFSNGPYDYLTVVECKNKKAKVAVREVEAFVTKSKRVHANKAVMVSTTGYQSGAVEVAEDEDIVLLNLVERNDTSPREHDLSVITMLKNTKTGESIVLGHGNNPTVELLDPNVRNSLAKKFALVGQDGTIVTEAFLTDLRLGKWQAVEVGKFYSQPLLGGYYFCESISPSTGLITWVLVETIQHGALLQARMEQKQEYASAFHVVTDKNLVRRLEGVLIEYRQKCPPANARPKP